MVFQVGIASQPSPHVEEGNGNLTSVSESQLSAVHDLTSSFAAELDSSPVVREYENSAASSMERLANSSKKAEAKEAGKNKANENEKHKESSSAVKNATSPAKKLTSTHGLFTPPHSRQLHDLEGPLGTPQTPTLPAATSEREDVFLGSSPTPGTRNSIPISRVEISTSIPTENKNVRLDNDPPSSPPEIRPWRSNNNRSTANPRKSTNPSTTAASNGNLDMESRGTNDDPVVVDASKEQTADATSNERENADKNQAREVVQGLLLGTYSPEKDSDMDPSPTVELTPESLRNRRIQEEGPPIEQSDAYAPEVEMAGSDRGDQAGGFTERMMDPCAEDLDSQIASQLEQDMEQAADMDARQIREARGASSSDSTPAKSKRREKSKGSGNEKRKRRSTSRGSSSKSPSDATPEARLTHGTKRTRDSSQTHDAPDMDLAQGSKRRKAKTSESKDVLEASVNVKAQEPAVVGIETNPENQKEASQGSSASSDREGGARTGSRNRKNRKKAQRMSRSSKENTPNVEISQTRSQAEEQHTHSHHVETVGEMPDRALPINPPEVPVIAKEVRADTEMGGTDQQVEQQTTVQEDNIVDLTEETGPITSVDEANKPSNRTMSSQATQTEQVDSTDNTESGIFNSLRKTLNDIKMTSLSRDALRRVDDLLFDIRVEAHDAFRRF